MFILHKLKQEWARLHHQRVETKRVWKSTPTQQQLCTTLVSGSMWGRREAAAALGQYHSQQAIECLCLAAQDSDGQVREIATKSLCEILERDIYVVQKQIAKTLVSIGEPAVYALCHVLACGSVRVRERAVRVLGNINDPCIILPLCDVLSDDFHMVRELAKETLIKIGAPAIEPLRKVLDEPNVDARRAAIESLSSINDPLVIRSLYRALADTDATVGWLAQEALANRGEPVVEGLCNALQNPTVSLRAQVALIKIGAPAVKPLCYMLKNSPREARKRAVQALGQLSDKRAIEPLCNALADKDVTWEVQEALAKIGPPAVEALCQALQHQSRTVRYGAAAALGTIGDARAVEPLCAALVDTEWLVREQIIHALGKIRDERTVGPLCQMLSDSISHVRARAAEALGQAANVAAIAPLSTVLEDDNALVREQAAVALGKIGRREALTGLRSRLRPLAGEGSLAVRAALHTAIKNIEKVTGATQGLPRAIPAEALNLSGLPRISEEIPAPEGRPRIDGGH